MKKTSFIVWSFIGLVMSSDCFSKLVASKHRTLKYPLRREVDGKTKVPEGLRINWKLLGLFDKPGKDCLIMGKIDMVRLCEEKGRKARANKDYKTAREYYRTSCREVHYTENYLYLKTSRQCYWYLEYAYRLGNTKQQEYIFNLKLNYIRYKRGLGGDQGNYLKSKHVGIIDSEICLKYDLEHCRHAIAHYLKTNKEKSISFLKHYCKNTSSDKCKKQKKATRSLVKIYGLTLTENENKVIDGI